MEKLADSVALLIVDFQKAIDDPKWGRRNNPSAEARAAELLHAWRDSGRPVVHVQHLSREADSPYRPGQPGCDFKDALQPGPGEILVQKQTNNAFIDTGLEASLRDRGITAVVVAGVLLHNSVDATVRMAANLGFEIWLVDDATASVDVVDLAGRRWPAEDVHALSLALLSGEYAKIVTATAVLQAAGRPVGPGGPPAGPRPLVVQ
ncbi:MAG: cysteine hydrolase family protein [Kiloniellaceae bacterium]